MDRSWYQRVVVLGGLCLLACYTLYPTYVFYAQATEEERASNQAFCHSLPSWSHCSKLNLGLDLQGGVQLVMGVRIDKALEHRLDRLMDNVKEQLQEKNMSPESLQRPAQTAQIRLRSQPEHGEATEAWLRKEYPMLTLQKSDGVLLLTLQQQEAEQVRDAAVEQTIKTIRNRADKLGVTEPTIARRGVDQILIQLPGVKDPERAMDIIGRTAQLEFTMVDPEASGSFRSIQDSQLPKDVVRQTRGGIGKTPLEIYFELPEMSRDEVSQLLSDHVPQERMVAFGPAQSADGKDRLGVLRTYVLHHRPGITGDYLINAQVQQNQELPNDYFVSMTFDAPGAKIFEKLTESNVGRQMAIVLDGKVSSAPVINEKIGGGTARITLGRQADTRLRFQEAKDLALVLKAGALPAPIEVREKRQVGKTLGEDTVKSGILAIVLGAFFVVVFMGVYYKGSGMLANAALILNVLFLLACLAMLDATLTLPGMAGIVLTIGMAVDANVLIFERIREELRLGKSIRSSIEAGYKKAWATIFDSNLTTLIAGAVLMRFGSGPVRGFAVTLIIGLLCSMYTAIVATRLIFDYMCQKRRLTHLSI